MDVSKNVNKLTLFATALMLWATGFPRQTLAASFEPAIKIHDSSVVSLERNDLNAQKILSSRILNENETYMAKPIAAGAKEVHKLNDRPEGIYLIRIHFSRNGSSFEELHALPMGPVSDKLIRTTTAVWDLKTKEYRLEKNLRNERSGIVDHLTEFLLKIHEKLGSRQNDEVKEIERSFFDDSPLLGGHGQVKIQIPSKS